MAERKDLPPDDDYPHWNRVYLGVILYTIALIIVLWIFSGIYE